MLVRKEILQRLQSMRNDLSCGTAPEGFLFGNFMMLFFELKAWNFAGCCLLLVVCRLLFAVCCLLFVVWCVVCVVCCLLFVVCRLLFVVVSICLASRGSTFPILYNFHFLPPNACGHHLQAVICLVLWFFESRQNVKDDLGWETRPGLLPVEYWNPYKPSLARVPM